MRTDLARNYVFGPKLAFCLGWHRAVFTLPGNLALDFKQMHPEGLMPERVWYDLCSAFSHNPENFRAKRHIFSLFSICCELYGSQSYFSVNLNFPGPPSTGSSEVLPLRVCYIIRNSLAAALTAAFRVHLDQISAGGNCCTAVIWWQDERHLLLFLSEDLLSYPVSSCIGLVGQKPTVSFPVVFRYRSINATAPKWQLIPGHQIGM